MMTLTVNGQAHAIDADPARPLLYLRDHTPASPTALPMLTKARASLDASGTACRRFDAGELSFSS